MRTGPKNTSVEQKVANGSYRPNSRHAPKQIIINAEPPAMPTYLTSDAQIVWMEEINRVIQAGTSELDSTFFADYCCVAAQVRDILKQGKMPRGNQLTELRKMRELLGIAGAPSRASRGKIVEPDDDNEFSKLLGD